MCVFFETGFLLKFAVDFAGKVENDVGASGSGIFEVIVMD